MAVIERDDEVIAIPDALPVLPLRDVVIFPGMITPLLVGRPKSLASLDEAMKGDRLLLVATQRQVGVDEPGPEDLYRMGTVVKILQLMRLVEGTMRILVEGVTVEKEAVLGANVTITASTPIIDVTGEQEVVRKGSVPARSVVVPGTRKKKFPAGEYYMPCALIIGQRKESTDRKTTLNEALRQFSVSV